MKSNGHVAGKAIKAPAFALRAERALRRAAKNVQGQNRALKLPLLVWKDEKVTPKKEIIAAINEKLVLRFVYAGKERIVEPQTYGVGRTRKEVCARGKLVVEVSLARTESQSYLTWKESPV